MALTSTGVDIDALDTSRSSGTGAAPDAARGSAPSRMSVVLVGGVEAAANTADADAEDDARVAGSAPAAAARRSASAAALASLTCAT